MAKKPQNLVIGIDPGFSGAIVLTNGDYLKTWAMPIVVHGKEKDVHFDRVHEILDEVFNEHGSIHVFLERAYSGGAGSKSAFNYGRGYQSVIIAIELIKFPLTYVEPGKWAKEMHEGISADLKPKVKSMVAAKRLFPKLVDLLPKNKNGKILDGPIDALLIAGYGLRKSKVLEIDFF